MSAIDIKRAAISNIQKSSNSWMQWAKPWLLIKIYILTNQAVKELVCRADNPLKYFSYHREDWNRSVIIYIG